MTNTGVTLRAFYDRLAAHDWFYQYSDDGWVYNRGSEDVARYAVMQARWAAEEAEERRALADPAHPRHAALVARRDAEEAARRDAARREERNARRRKGDGHTYRKLTAQEQRRGMSAFHEGYQKADSVSLDRQIDRTETKRTT